MATALIHHPSVTHYIRFMSTTVGRDKILRFIQYFSRFYAWYLFRTNHPESSYKPFEATKKQLGITRKILRLGKFVEHLKEAANLSSPAISNGKSSTLDNNTITSSLSTLFNTSRQLGYAGYLSLDGLTVLDAIGANSWTRAKQVGRWSQQCWIVGLVSSVLAGMITMKRLRERRERVDRKEGSGVAESKRIDTEWNTALLQMTTDLCDMSIPATGLGYITLDDGAVGLLGVFSSLVGIYNVWQKSRK